MRIEYRFGGFGKPRVLYGGKVVGIPLLFEVFIDGVEYKVELVIGVNIEKVSREPKKPHLSIYALVNGREVAMLRYSLDEECFVGLLPSSKEGERFADTVEEVPKVMMEHLSQYQTVKYGEHLPPEERRAHPFKDKLAVKIPINDLRGLFRYIVLRYIAHTLKGAEYGAQEAMH